MGPRTGTPMSGAERARRFRERRKAAAADLASTSTTGIPVLMDVTNEQTIDISIESATELRDVNISRSEAMQNHWRSADKRIKTVFEANPFGLSCSVCDRLWFERDLKKVKHGNISLLQTKFPDENVTEIRLCSTCSKSIDANKIPQNSYLVEFMRNEFGLNYVQTSPTTLGNTTIDCTFTRNINVDIMPYVAHFTYHRPMLYKIVVEY
ncbi:hypothetical protein EVAR_99932_1 [Eumeta japonica]|uniref:Uncharacterized protein n=1 Tax=Eumeta variegata TaxID=151549 RepID=A0A4C1Z2K5_EUMVA|nr:hypothetical protein EVAR_99932_1 [Eumeta japonica]